MKANYAPTYMPTDETKAYLTEWLIKHGTAWVAWADARDDRTDSREVILTNQAGYISHNIELGFCLSASGLALLNED